MTIATRGQGAPPDPDESGQSSCPVGSHVSPFPFLHNICQRRQNRLEKVDSTPAII